jgi:WD40 repeat protein/serine/threonine protein kinase
MEHLADNAGHVSLGTSTETRLPSSEAMQELMQRLMDAGPPERSRADRSSGPRDSSDGPPEGACPSIAGYEILGELGRGGMGIVYRARQTRLQRLVALKMIRADQLARPDRRRRFCREAETVARLHHPHIIQIYETGDQDGQLFYSMELVEGGNLAQYLNGRPQNPRLAAQVGETLARAVHHAHLQGIIHRDLKPANLLLCNPPQDGSSDATAEQSTPLSGSSPTPPHVKIADFGLAKIYQEGVEVSAGLTGTDNLLGTPGYAAPEQLSHKKVPVGPGADIHALGVILFEMLTGTPPFVGVTVMQTLLHVLHQEPLPPTRLQSGIPQDLETIVLKCLQKEPARRYATALELAEDLKRFLSGEPILARPVSAVERGWRWCRRNPSLAVVTGLAAVALIAVAVVSTVFAVHAYRTSNALREEKGLAEQRERLARSRLSEQELDRALTLCINESDARQGMLWLARALKSAPPQAEDLQRTIRTSLTAWGWNVPALEQVDQMDGPIQSVVLSPDGSTLAVNSREGSVRLWDAKRLVPFGELIRHAARIKVVAFRSDSRRLLTASEDKTARQWDTVTGKPVGPVLAHSAPVNVAAYSPDGKQIVTGNVASLRLWDAETGKPGLLFPVERADVFAVAAAFSPDGRLLLAGYGDKTARLWGVGTGRLLRQFPVLNSVWGVAFSPDGKTMLTADAVGRLWRTAQAVPNWIPDLVPAAWNQVLPIAELRPREARGRLLAGVVVAHFSPDGRTVLTGHNDGMVQLWSAATGAPLGDPLVHETGLICLGFSGDGLTMVSVVSGTARLWQKERRGSWEQESDPAVTPFTRLRWTLRHNGPEGALAYSADGTLLATGRWDGSVRFWRVPAERQRVLVWERPCWGIAFSPDARTVLASTDARAVLYRTDTGRAVGPPLFPPLGGTVGAMAFSPDGKSFVTASENPQGAGVQRWDASAIPEVGGSWKPLGPALPHAFGIRLAFGEDGNTLVTKTEPDKVRLWDVRTGRLRGRPTEADQWLRTVSLSPTEAYSSDGKVVVRAVGNTARLSEVATERALGQGLQHQQKIQVVALRPDGNMVLTGTEGGTAQLWDAQTCKPIGPAWRLFQQVRVATFSPDGKLAGTCDNVSARLWNIPAPLAGSPEQIEVWVQVLTGLELDEYNVVRSLDAAGWKERCRRLADLGGPPEL